MYKVTYGKYLGVFILGIANNDCSEKYDNYKTRYPTYTLLLPLHFSIILSNWYFGMYVNSCDNKLRPVFIAFEANRIQIEKSFFSLKEPVYGTFSKLEVVTVGQ